MSPTNRKPTPLWYARNRSDGSSAKSPRRFISWALSVIALFACGYMIPSFRIPGLWWWLHEEVEPWIEGAVEIVSGRLDVARNLTGLLLCVKPRAAAFLVGALLRLFCPRRGNLLVAICALGVITANCTRVPANFAAIGMPIRFCNWTYVTKVRA